MKDMEKEKTKVSIEKKKLSIERIKRNADVDVLHTIKRVKKEERRTILLLSSMILICLLFCSYLIFAGMTKYNGDNINDGLEVKYVDNDDGMGDIVNFNSEEGIVSLFSTEFTISNNKGKNSWYAIYLDDYADMIEYDGCFDKEIDKTKIFFRIDGGDAVSLASSYVDGRYALTQGIVTSNGKVTHNLQVWYSEEASGHYHGKIAVEYIR